MIATIQAACRSCGGLDLAEVVNLGDQVVSDFVPAGQAVERCPIVLDLCRRCGLVQARWTVGGLYQRYWYRSGVTDTMRRELAAVVEAARKVVQIATFDVVLDVGSNDGTLLRHWNGPGLPHVHTVGVEPADNLQEEARKNAGYALHDFWPPSARTHENMTLAGVPLRANCKVITACGMLYDCEDPNPFVAEVARCLKPDGVFIVQLMCLRQMIETNDVGNLAHEHLEYWSLDAFARLLRRHGLHLWGLEENTVNNGSYRLFIGRKGASMLPIRKDRVRLHDNLFSAKDREASMGLKAPDTLRRWAADLAKVREACRRTVLDLIAAGKKVAVYGASTKGNVILQWLGLDSSTLAMAAERSPEKWGRETAGTGIPIVEEAKARAWADVFLVLPYTFLNEFLARERPWLERGGKFLVPLPRPVLIGLDNGLTVREEIPI